MKDRKLFEKIVEMQDEFNSSLHTDWTEQKWDWMSCILCETSELIESLAYKHWKFQEVDYDNARVEAVDLLHFIVSKQIEEYGKDIALDNLCTWFVECNIEVTNPTLEQLRYDAYKLIGSPERQLYYLARVFTQLDMTNEDIYRAYIVKNCLNVFRQKHGYLDNSYIKIWNGDKEDNYVATQLSNQLICDKNMYDLLYTQLELYYERNVK